MFHVLISVLVISTWCVLLHLDDLFSFYLECLGMDRPNSSGNLPCAPPTTTWTFCFGWFRSINPGNTGANLRNGTLLSHSGKEHGMDRQEGETSSGIIGWDEGHQILCLGDTLFREDIKLQEEGNGVRFCSFSSLLGINSSVFLDTSARCCSSALRTTLWRRACPPWPPFLHLSPIRRLVMFLNQVLCSHH